MALTASPLRRSARRGTWGRPSSDRSTPVAPEGRAEPGAEAEVEHASALVAPEGLHGGIVDHPHGLAEGLGIVEAHPARSEVVRLGGRPPVHHRARIPDRNAIVAPAGDRLL